MSERTGHAEHEHADEGLHQSEELVRALLSATGEGIYGVDLDGNCTFVNPACVALLGYRSDRELLGRNMHELIHHTRPDGAPYPVEQCRIYQAFREGEGTHVGDEIVWRADGGSCPVEYWSYPVELHGELVGCVVAFVDISERKQAEQELREREKLVRALLNATGEGIYGVDLDGNCTFANPACVDLLGYRSDRELLGRNMHELIHHTRPDGEPYPVEQCRIYQAFREGEGTHVGDEIVWRSDGTSFPAEYWSSPLHLRDELIGCVVAFVDTTERKRTEEELRQSEKLAALGKLSAGLAHELNNPAAAAQRASAQLRERLGQLQSLATSLGQRGLSAAQWSGLTAAAEGDAGDGGAPPMSPLERADREEALGGWLSAHEIPDPWQLTPALVSAGLDTAALDALASELPAETSADAAAWLSGSLAAGELVETLATSTGSISELVGAVKTYTHMDQAPEQEVDIHDGLESTLRILQHKLEVYRFRILGHLVRGNHAAAPVLGESAWRTAAGVGWPWRSTSQASL